MNRVKTFIKKRKYLLIVLAVLIGFRIWLPYYVKNKLVAAINEVENYSCTIEDVDISIFRAAMVLQEFEIMLTDNEVPEPYVAVNEADISVEWRAILQGAIVGEIYIDQPVMHFSDGEDESEKQAGDVSWVQPILDFIPLKINRLEIVDGKVEFANDKSTPAVNLELTGIEFLATNLTNAQQENDSLPSDVILRSTIYDKGNLEVTGKMNILKDMPDMDLDINIKNVDLTELNDFTEAYAAFDFEKGNFSLAAEFAMMDSEILGYVKPILEDVNVFSFKEEGKTLNKFWQAFLGFCVEITENQRNDQSATKVPIEGKIENPDIGIFPTIGNIFKNAFIEAFTKNTDNTIDIEKLKNKKDNSSTLKEKIKSVFN